MSQDIVADVLNQIMNGKKAGKTEIESPRYSKLLISVLALGKLKGYIKDYRVESGILKVNIEKVNACGAIKPRFEIPTSRIERFVSRYLPARHIGIIIISTSKGLMTHTTAMEKNVGGSLIAYMY